MADTAIKKLTSMEPYSVTEPSPYEAALKEVGYKKPETTQQEKFLKDKAEADIRVAGEKKRLGKESLERTEEIYGRPELQQQKLDAFTPSQESGSDLAKLFALTTAIAFIGGGRGRYSGMTAMNNLASAMEGYRKGRKDLFTQEMKEYDKNMKATLENNRIIQEHLKKYLELAAKKDANAATELEMIKALTGRQGALAEIEKLTENDKAKVAETLAKSRADWKKHVDDVIQKKLDRDERRSSAERTAIIRAGGKDAKPPPKEIVAQNQLRNTLIPKIEESLPVLDRLNKEGKWNTMTTLLAVDPRAAELQFKNDPEALSLILTLAYFRSKEFETAGKALTKKEDQILAPIVRGDLRSYEGLKNAMESGLKTLKSEQKGLEATYPFIKTYNDVLRGEAGESAPPAPSGKPMPTGEKLKAYAEQHFNGDEAAAIDYLRTQGYQ